MKNCKECLDLAESKIFVETLADMANKSTNDVLQWYHDRGHKIFTKEINGTKAT